LALAAAVTFQLFYLGAQPFAAGLIPVPWDKLAHLAVFAFLTTLLWIGTAGRIPLAVIVTAIAIGALDELHQASLPGRVADAADFLADACAATGTGIFLFLLHARRKASERDGTTGLAAQAHTTSLQESLGAVKTAP
jgi:VanZ family protein